MFLVTVLIVVLGVCMAAAAAFFSFKLRRALRLQTILLKHSADQIEQLHAQGDLAAQEIQ
jgi:hypothetical protein